MSGALAPPSPDAEARSICPLLATPSPTTEIEHPLAALQLSSNQDLEDIVILDTTTPDYKIMDEQPKPMPKALQTLQNEGDSASVGSVEQGDQNTSDNLLNSNVYYNLNCEENDRMKARNIIQYLNKKQNYAFVYWNWPLIRKTCLCSMFSFMIVMLCTVIVMIMTQPKNCDPPETWRRKAFVYEIFTASFQDSNNDGYGDLRGVAMRLEYLKHFGVNILRLNSIFTSPNYPDDYRSVETLMKIAPILGSTEDLRFLVDRAHGLNMSIILDLPIHHPTYKLENPSEFYGRPQTNYTETVEEVFRYWLDQNIDGFYVKGVEQIQDEKDFVTQMSRWRSIADYYNNKLLVASYHLVENLRYRYGRQSARLKSVKATFDMVEFRLNNLKNMSEEADRLNTAYDIMDEAWILWSLSNSDKPRISPYNTSTAGVLLQFMLPGIPNVFYGEEVGLQNVQVDDDIEDQIQRGYLFQFAPMYWKHATSEDTSERPGFTSSSTPWMRRAQATCADNFDTLRTGFQLRTSHTNMYLNGFCKQSSFMKTFNVRYSDKSVIAIERTYPRKSSFLYIGNFGRTFRKIDLSRIFSDGDLIMKASAEVDHRVNIDLHNIELYPGEAYILMMK